MDRVPTLTLTLILTLPLDCVKVAWNKKCRSRGIGLSSADESAGRTDGESGEDGVEEGGTTEMAGEGEEKGALSEEGEGEPKDGSGLSKSSSVPTAVMVNGEGSVAGASVPTAMVKEEGGAATLGAANVEPGGLKRRAGGGQGLDEEPQVKGAKS